MSLSLSRISDHVWIAPHHADVNRVQSTVGAIISHDATVLVDAGNSPRLAREIMAALSEMQAPPLRHIIYTHHHWDHVFGASVFGVPVIAHEQCRLYLEQMSRQHWSDTVLRVHERNPDLKLDYTPSDWEAFQIVLPQLCFSHGMSLELAGLRLGLSHVGGIHAADSIVVTVAGDEVMFLGDCYYPANLTAGPIDTVMLAKLAKPEINTYIDGHRAPMNRAKLERIIRLYQHLPHG